MTDFSQYGVSVPKILLPKDIDLEKWAVIACDQYTQDRAYWKRAADIAGGNPSTLNLIFPEVYLADADKDERIQNIKKAMGEYLNGDVFADGEEEFIYIERKTAYGRTRKGLVVAVDLDMFSCATQTSCPCYRRFQPQHHFSHSQIFLLRKKRAMESLRN